MNGPGKELRHLVGFLNAKEEKGAPLRDELRKDLMFLLTPNAVPPLWAKHEARKAYQHTRKLYATPANTLRRFVENLNARAVKPTWSVRQARAGEPSIKFDYGYSSDGGPFSVTRTDFGDTEDGYIWSCVAKLLETGEIIKLGCCATCQKFCSKNRYWQMTCLNSECHRRYDNIMRKERKAVKSARRQRKSQGRFTSP
jgi:hypothetical protein